MSHEAEKHEKDQEDKAALSRDVPPSESEPVRADAVLQHSALTLEEKIASNTWDHLKDFLAVAKKASAGEWHWYENSKCKYVGLRIDMRTLHCIIMDRDGNRIDPKDLAYQYSTEKRHEPS